MHICLVEDCVKYNAQVPDLGIAKSGRALAWRRKCARIAGQAVMLHRGSGYMMDSDIQRYYRDCKGLEIWEGTSHIQCNTIADQPEI